MTDHPVKQRTLSLDLCPDCAAFAHGFSEAERGEDYPDEVTTAMSSYPMGTLTPGLTVDKHADACKIAWATDGSMPDECECERTTFTHSPCDICRRPLAGDREAFTYWYESDL